MKTNASAAVPRETVKGGRMTERESIVARAAARIGVALLAVAAALLGPAVVPAVAAPPPRVVTLSFDDGRASQGVVDGLLASRHLHGTFFIITRSVNTGADPESLSWGQIHRLARDGNEIGGHTRTHPHLPTLSPSAQADEICGGRRDLLAQGFHPVSFAYPYGEYDATSEAVVARCYAGGRAAQGGVETVPPADRYAIRTLQNVTTADTPASLEAQTWAARPGQWLNYVFHDIGGPTEFNDEYRITTKDFVAFLDWVRHQRDAGRIVVRTVGQIVA
jgi:peptidoglycan/xylan/chitin deacetylase (PgdA/CDA1 family)